MITNTRLISFRTAAEPNASGGETPGTLTTFASPIDCCVDQPTRTQLYRGADKIVGLKAAMWVYAQAGLDLQEDGQVTFRRIIGGIQQPEETMRIAQLTTYSHRGQDHHELLLTRI